MGAELLLPRPLCRLGNGTQFAGWTADVLAPPALAGGGTQRVCLPSLATGGGSTCSKDPLELLRQAVATGGALYQLAEQLAPA